MADATGFVPVINAKIIEEFSAERTGGNFATETIAWDAAVGETVKDVTISMPTCLLAAFVHSGPVTTGDAVALDVDPNKVIGNLPSDVAAQETEIPLPATMKAAYEAGLVILGMRVSLDDGTNEDLLGLLLDIDIEGDVFTTEHATEHAFLAETPTEVKLTASMSPGIFNEDSSHRGWVELVSGDHHQEVGLSKVGGDHVPAGSMFRFRYKNTGSSTIRVVIRLEFLY